MFRSFALFLATGILMLVPQAAFAANATFFGPIVPPECNCEAGSEANPSGVPSAPDFGCVLQTVQNSINFGVSMIVIIITLMIAYSGIMFMVNPTNAEQRSAARGMVTNAFIGLAIVLSAWLLIDFVMKQVFNDKAEVNGAAIGPWNAILGDGDASASRCIVPKEPPSAVPGGVADNDGGLTTAPGPTQAPNSNNLVWQATMSSAGINHAAQAARGYKTELCAAARANGLSSNAAQRLFGILGVESAGQTGVVSPAGAVGLMQLLPGTARGLDSSLKNLSDLQIKDKLKDGAYNITLGVKYYAQLYRHFNGNETYATAAYNAGTGTGKTADGKKQPFAPSSNCPGLYAWECKTNAGGFAETQKYVGNVPAVATAAGSNLCAS